MSMIAPTRISEDIRQMMALLELREAIAPSDLPLSLHFHRAGDIDLLEFIERRIALLRAEIDRKERRQ